MNAQTELREIAAQVEGMIQHTTARKATVHPEYVSINLTGCSGSKIAAIREMLDAEGWQHGWGVPDGTTGEYQIYRSEHVAW